MTVNHIFYRMDKKGGGNHVIYPDIMFCVDGFEEVCVYVYMSVQTVYCVNDVSILCRLSSDLQ